MFPKISLPLQLLFVIATVILFGSYIPTDIIQAFYTLSVIFKECLNFLLPFMVFAFICTGILSFKQRAPIVIAIMVSLVFISNMLTPLVAYFVTKILLPYITNNIVLSEIATQPSMQSLISLSLPQLLKPEHAIFIAVGTGTIVSYFNISQAEPILIQTKKCIEWIVNNLFIPILPFYIFGFLIELHHRGVFFDLCQSYGKTYALIITLQISLLLIYYFIAAGFNIQRTIVYIKNALPSYLTAFGTMSSTASIPVTIKCAEKNTHNKPLAEIATPILANIHMLGDAVTVPVLSIVTLFVFQGTTPVFTTFFTFVLYYSTTMLAASGIPGGGIMVTIPILKSILGCSDAMISIMITLHLLQDGFGTGGNVMGDGAIMIVINKILKKLKDIS